MKNISRNLTMLCDFYELTMSNGYFKCGVKDKTVYFDVFYRDNPDGGGFAVVAGLEQIVEYINEHFKEEISVSSISNELYLSRGRLADVFKKYSGVSITEYINSLRINNANYMLMHGSTATEAALESGFASVRTFNNVYKSVMNMTPSEYVKKKES